jgi:hypothetical protein
MKKDTFTLVSRAAKWGRREEPGGTEETVTTVRTVTTEGHTSIYFFKKNQISFSCV